MRFLLASCAVLLVACGNSAATVDDVLLEDVAAEGEGLLSLADARLVSVPGSNLRVAVWEKRLGAARDESAYAVARGAGSFSTAKRTRLELLYRGSRVDPTMEPGAAEASLQVVQFYSAVMPEYLAALEAAGVELLHPFPRNAYVVRMSERVAAVVAAQSYVRAVSPFTASARVDLGGFDGVRPRPYLIRAATRRSDDLGALVAELKALGAEVNDATIGDSLLEATLDGTQLRTIAASPLVLHVDPWAQAEPDVDKARELSGANFIERTLGFTGQGVSGEVMDGNVFDQHVDLKGRIVFHGEHTGDDSHGTCTTGLVFGAGVGRAAARGMLPAGRPIFGDYDQLSAASGGSGTRDRRAHTQELVRPPYEAVFQSNSWGSALTTQYTNVSAELDGILFDFDFLLFNSQSNNGSQSSRPQAWAKNAVSIGGVKHQDTADLADDRWDYGGSIGPASDGRIKPDLAHFWDRTLAPAAGGGYDEDFGGTSGATPMTAGLSGLFLQMWANGVFGNPTPGRTVFENRPHFTTAKAVLINTATAWAFSGENHDLTRVHQGWGRIDLTRLYGLRNNLLVVNETELLTVGQTAQHVVKVAANTPELRATLTWADPPGLPSAGMHRVNDLTLKVTDPAGVVYFGNNGLKAGMFSTPGGTANTIDTVENVFVARPTAGDWVVEVRADDVAQDGHVETPALDADFALVVSGITPKVAGAAPTVNLVAPAPGSTVSGTVEVRATASDADGTVDHVRFGLPNGSFVDVNAPFTTSYDTTLAADGNAQFTAVAFDNSGLSSPLASVDVVVQNAAPNQAPTVTLSVPSGVLTGVVTFSATAADPDGAVRDVTFTLPDGSQVVDSSAPYSVSFATTTVANGSWPVSALATDLLGATSPPGRATVVINNPTTWSAASTASFAVVNNTTSCGTLRVVTAGSASTVRLTFSMRHTYRKALRLSLRHGSQAAVVIEAGTLAPSSGTVQRSRLVVPGFSGSSAGDWQLCIEDTDLTQSDKGTVNSWSLRGT